MAEIKRKNLNIKKLIFNPETNNIQNDTVIINQISFQNFEGQISYLQNKLYMENSLIFNSLSSLFLELYLHLYIGKLVQFQYLCIFLVLSQLILVFFLMFLYKQIRISDINLFRLVRVCLLHLCFPLSRYCNFLQTYQKNICNFILAMLLAFYSVIVSYFGDNIKIRSFLEYFLMFFTIVIIFPIFFVKFYSDIILCSFVFLSLLFFLLSALWNKKTMFVLLNCLEFLIFISYIGIICSNYNINYILTQNK